MNSESMIPRVIMTGLMVAIVITVILIIIVLFTGNNSVTNYTVSDKIIDNKSIDTVTSYYIKDNTKSYPQYYRVDKNMFDYMQVGNSYSCSIPKITMGTITDINSTHRVQSMCKVI